MRIQAIAVYDRMLGSGQQLQAARLQEQRLKAQVRQNLSDASALRQWNQSREAVEAASAQLTALSDAYFASEIDMPYRWQESNVVLSLSA